MIAKENDDTSWVSEVEWKSYSSMIRKHGNMIIGRRTYEVMLKNDEFNRSNLNKIRTVVVTKSQIKIFNPKFVSAAKSPREAIETLKKEGFKTIMVCGGGKLNSSFMEENLIDEIYIDVEPIVFGKGTRLFEDSVFEAKLKLLEVKKLSKNEIQLHYEILKD